MCCLVDIAVVESREYGTMDPETSGALNTQDIAPGLTTLLAILVSLY